MKHNFGNKEELVDVTSLFITETDAKGNIIYCNDAFCKIAGYNLEELIGQPHSMIRHPFMPAAAFKDLWDTVSRGDIWDGIVINKTKNGGYYWVKANVYKSQQSNGKVKYISVRVKATNEEIDEVVKLYPTL